MQRLAEPRAFTFVSEMSAGRWVAGGWEGRGGFAGGCADAASRLWSSEMLKDQRKYLPEAIGEKKPSKGDKTESAEIHRLSPAGASGGFDRLVMTFVHSN